MTGIWKTLGIGWTRERNDIRRAYAALLKKTNPEDNPEGFKRLREAYDAALTYADQGYEPYSFDGGDEDWEEDEEAGEAAAFAEDGPYDLDAATLDRTTLRDERRRLRAEGGDAETLEIDGEAAAEPPRRTRTVRRAPADPEASSRRRDFDAACARLASLTARPDADPEALAETAAEVLGSETLVDLGIYSRTEAWMADLIAYNFPRSDALVEAAIERFEWRSRGRTLSVTHAIQTVLSRQDDLRFLRQIRSKRHPQHAAFRSLSGSDKPNSLWLRTKAPWTAREVRKLLEKIEYEHPTLRNDLDEDAIDWWRDYFGTPRLGPMTWLVVFVAPLVIALFGFMIGAPPPRRLINAGTAYLFSAGLLLALVLVKHFAFDLPRHRWRREWSWRTPEWARTGWAGLGLATLALAAVLPAHPAAAAVLGFLSMAVLVWAFAVADETEQPMDWAARIGRPIWTNLLLLVCWFLMIGNGSGERTLQLSVPVLAVVIAYGRSPLALFTTWNTVLVRWQRLTAIGGLAAVAAGLVAWLTSSQSALSPLIATAAVAVVLLQRVPALLQDVTQQKIRYYATLGMVVLGWVFLTDLDLTHGALAAGVLLIGAVVSLALSAMAELDRP